MVGTSGGGRAAGEGEPIEEAGAEGERCGAAGQAGDRRCCMACCRTLMRDEMGRDGVAAGGRGGEREEGKG